jgi:hypothetical protein
MLSPLENFEEYAQGLRDFRAVAASELPAGLAGILAHAGNLTPKLAERHNVAVPGLRVVERVAKGCVRQTVTLVVSFDFVHRSPQHSSFPY